MSSETRGDGALRQRGIQRPADPRVWGSVVGAIGGSVFVLANSALLPTPWPLVALAAWVLALPYYVLAVFVLPRWFAAPRPPRRGAGLIYVLAVGAMLALIQLGRLALGPDRAQVLPAVIVLCVGLHLLPFAGAFNMALFTRLGLVMTALGVLGVLFSLWLNALVAPAIAVVTGFVMLVMIATDAVRTQPGGASVR